MSKLFNAFVDYVFRENPNAYQEYLQRQLDAEYMEYHQYVEEWTEGRKTPLNGTIKEWEQLNKPNNKK